MKEDQVYKVLILPDMQVPYEDKKTLRVVEKYMAHHKWDEVLYLGDYMDFDQISSFNKEALRKLETKRLLKDYDRGNEILDRHQRIVQRNNKHCKWTMLEGNHEFRIERLIDSSPQLEGLLEVEKQLRFKQRGFKYVRSWKDKAMYKIGNAYFVHGLYTNQHHAKKMVENYGVSIYYGHTHDVMSFPKVLRGKDKTIEGHSLGCLCEYDQQYIKGEPTNWQQAFSVMYVQPNGFYNLYVCRIFNHKFVSPDGKFYE